MSSTNEEDPFLQVQQCVPPSFNCSHLLQRPSNRPLDN
jgi:hypothetical protein